MAINAPDLSNMPPKFTAAIYITLILAAVALEAADSPNTLTIIAVMVGVLGLQQSRTAQKTDRIEEQTNGKLSARLDAMIAPVMEALNQIKQRLDRDDRRFDELAAENAEHRRRLAEMQQQIDQLVNCETKSEVNP